MLIAPLYFSLMAPLDPRRFPVVLSQDEEGFFNVACPVVPGRFSQGRTREDALANIREAIELSRSIHRALEGLNQQRPLTAGSCGMA
jgi:predicted RNase H-like HicB family nuclease